MSKRPSVPPSAPAATVSGRWLVTAIVAALAGAIVFMWTALCLMYWQGSWQLLYHPSSTVARTPAAAGLAFDPIAFATTESGVPQLKGWWIPGPANARFTAIYLHGADGNLGDTVNTLARLHAAGLNVLAFDYRGYGESRFAHPSEAGWRADAEAAIDYLTGTRHIAPGSLVLVGSGLGANLALEIAAEQPQFAGVVMDRPLTLPANMLFRDPRARIVPAHLLNADRWNMTPAAIDLRIPSLWFEVLPEGASATLDSFKAVTAPKMLVWLAPRDPHAEEQQTEALARWLGDLGAPRR